MAKFEFDDLELSFEYPDRPKVRALARYWSVVHGDTDQATMFERVWEAARPLIENWQCEYMALDTDLDEADDPRMVTALRAAGMAVFTHIRALETTPKK